MDMLHLDVETISRADLKKTGAYRYASDPSTDVIVASYRFGKKGKVQRWLPTQPCPIDILDHINNDGFVAAWNASFERNIWGNILTPKYSWPRINLEKFVCTMAQAAYWGLPLSLDMASQAMGGPPKDKEGHSLMLRMSRPRSVNVDGTYEWWHVQDAARYIRLQEYCDQDVRAEAHIAYAVPLLPESERKVYILDQQVNDLGVWVDTDLVHSMSRYANRAKTKLDNEMAALTGGEIKTCNQVAKILAFVSKTYSGVSAMDKGSVAAALADVHLTGAARRVVELRQMAAKSSTAKLGRMLACVGPQDRVRGMLQYYGASRTGRHAGRLIQPQNMPRGEIKDTEKAIQWMLKHVDAEMLEMTFGPILSIVSSCLRGCLAAPKGKTFAVVDFSQIEARVLAWEAGQKDILQVFENGEDVYVYDAAQIGSDNRALGKVCRLGLGFGMGKGKFVETALGYGLTLTEEFAGDVVKGWRKANPYIVGFWYDCQDAAVKAITNRKIYNVGKVDYAMMGKNLVCKLPSGRYLVYRDARVELDDMGRPRITYMGVNQFTRKWERQDTWGGKLVENITQAIARDLMIEALMRVWNGGFQVLLTVHDELIVEIADINPKGQLADIERLIKINPGWAQDLPTDCDGWVGPRYRK
jgi:DNA polymerase